MKQYLFYGKVWTVKEGIKSIGTQPGITHIPFPGREQK